MADQPPNEPPGPQVPEAAPAAETPAPAVDNRPPHASHHHGRLLDQMRIALEAQGEAAYQRFGLALFHSFSDEEAETEREKLGITPKDALDHYNRGCLLAAREDFTAAAAAFERAVKLEPELAEALYNLALAQERAGNAAQARKSWNSFVERFGDRPEIAEVRDHLAQTAV